jgi:hypothetical protein
MPDTDNQWLEIAKALAPLTSAAAVAALGLLFRDAEEERREHRIEEQRLFEKSARTWTRQIRRLLLGRVAGINDAADVAREAGRIPESIRRGTLLPVYDQDVRFALWASERELLEVVYGPGSLAAVRLPRLPRDSCSRSPPS